jgi:hypothetical protein
MMPNGTSALRKDTDKKYQYSDEPAKNTWIDRPVIAIREKRQNNDAQNEEGKRNPFPSVHEQPTYLDFRARSPLRVG